MKISKHKRIIQLWDTPRRTVRDSSPCFCASYSLGTRAPWLIARDKTTRNKCQEGAPMGSHVQCTCVCSYLGEHSFWEPKFTSSSLGKASLASSVLSSSSPGQGLISEEVWLRISMNWEAIFPHKFASVFFLQFVFSALSTPEYFRWMK